MDVTYMDTVNCTRRTQPTVQEDKLETLLLEPAPATVQAVKANVMTHCKQLCYELICRAFTTRELFMDHHLHCEWCNGSNRV